MRGADLKAADIEGGDQMLSRKLLGISAFAGTIAVSLWTWMPSAWSGPPSPADGTAQYAPIQSISQDFGSKSVRGYFVQRAGGCLVTLMVSERSDPDKSLPPSATRMRLVLSPGQIAGLDSEGRSLNLTCSNGATTLLVDMGETERLVELQAHALQKVADD
jgi:hypothetical protein